MFVAEDENAPSSLTFVLFFFPFQKQNMRLDCGLDPVVAPPPPSPPATMSAGVVVIESRLMDGRIDRWVMISPHLLC